MKRLFLILFVFVAAVSCKKDDTPALDSFIRDNYTQDAQQILIRRIQAGEKIAGYDRAEFDQSEVDKVLRTFQAVYNLHNRITDSIFNIHKVHTFPAYSLNYISLHLLANAPESVKILAGQPSGNNSFDTLMASYGYTYNASLFPNTPFTDIKSAKSYNVFAIIAQLKQFPFIVNAERVSTFGGGNDIAYVKRGNSAFLDFVIGWGDCPAGCINRSGWRYFVSGNWARLVSTYSR